MTPTDWLLGNDTGTSSKTICAVMTGSTARDADVPYDPDDFGRCYRLLRHFPEWRQRLGEVAAKHPAWGPMVAAWDELTTLYEEEAKRTDRRMPKLYDRMKTLVDDGRLADGWKQTGPGCWEKDTATSVSLGDGVTLSFGR